MASLSSPGSEISPPAPDTSPESAIGWIVAPSRLRSPSSRYSCGRIRRASAEIREKISRMSRVSARSGPRKSPELGARSMRPILPGPPRPLGAAGPGEHRPDQVRRGRGFSREPARERAETVVPPEQLTLEHERGDAEDPDHESLVGEPPKLVLHLGRGDAVGEPVGRQPGL